MEKRKILNIIIYLILFLILICSSIKIFIWYKDKTNNDKIIKEIKDKVVVKNDAKNEKKDAIDVNKIKNENNEVVAWIKVNNTNIDYPVVKTSNNNFYLNHSFDKSVNSAGWIFADYKNKFDGTDKNIVIYGHNMRDGSMFGSLKNILKEEWYNNIENTKIILTTENEEISYEVFSVYKIETEDYYIKTDFSTNSEYQKFLNTIKNRSIKDFNIDISSTDNILTLSTCANNNRYRVVLHAKRV